MGWFSDSSDQAQAYDAVMNAPPKAKFSQEALAAAASYEAAKMYENHVRANGQPESHGKAKELIAAMAGGFIDRMVQKKGISGFDNQQANLLAQQQSNSALLNQGFFI